MGHLDVLPCQSNAENDFNCIFLVTSEPSISSDMWQSLLAGHPTLPLFSVKV
jgi:hypothetical protein